MSPWRFFHLEPAAPEVHLYHLDGEVTSWGAPVYHLDGEVNAEGPGAPEVHLYTTWIVRQMLRDLQRDLQDVEDCLSRACEDPLNLC